VPPPFPRFLKAHCPSATCALCCVTRLLETSFKLQSHAESLNPDGCAALQELGLPRVPGLKTICGPGGVYMNLNYGDEKVYVMVPQDTAATVANLTYIYDIFPWRVPAQHAAGATYPFVLSGANFNALSKSGRVEGVYCRVYCWCIVLAHSAALKNEPPFLCRDLLGVSHHKMTASLVR
jgi:hypothetical protein